MLHRLELGFGDRDLHERRRLLGAMARFRDAAIVKEAMTLTVTDEFDARESMTLVWGASRWQEIRQLAFEFVKANFDTQVARMPRDAGANHPRMAVQLCTERARADVERFFRVRSSKFTGELRSLDQALGEIRQCSAFRIAQLDSVAGFFDKRAAADP